MRKLVIIGGGGHGRCVKDIALQLHCYEDIIVLDDDPSNGVDKCANYLNYCDDDTEVYVAFGNNEMRMKYIGEIMGKGIELARIIHPSAYVSPSAKIESGSIIFPLTIINTDVIIRTGCIINCGAIIDHGCIIEDGVHIGPGAVVKAENRVPKCYKLDANEVISIRTFPM